MTIRPLDGSKPRLTVDVPTQPKAVERTAEASTSSSQPSLQGVGSTFDDAKKKLLSLGKTNTRQPAVQRNGAPPAGTLQVKDLARAQGATKTALSKEAKQAVADITASKEPSKATAFAAAALSLPPDQQLAVLKALPKSIRNQLMTEFKKDPANTVLGGLAVALTRDMSAAELKEAASAMRTGKGAGMKEAAIAAELAARTEWGKGNADVVARFREQISGGHVSLSAGSNKNALAETMDDGSMRFDPSLARTPEGLAANMAHEGTHSKHGPDALAKDPLSEEVAGNLAGASVFKQLKGNPNDPALSKDNRDSLKEYGDLVDSPAKFRGRVAGRYATEAGLAAAKGVHTSDNRAKIDKIVAQLAKEPETAKAMSTDDYERLLGGIERTHGDDRNASLQDFGKLLKQAPADVQKAVLATALHDMDAASQKVIADAMK